MSPTRLLTLASLLVAMVFIPWTMGSVVAQGTGMSVTVPLKEYDGSGFTGTAVLTETTTGGTHVSMTLVGAGLRGNHPTHIHTGTCDNFDPNPLYPLETFNLSPVGKEGVSETDVEDVSLPELHDGKYVILVHKSPTELTQYLVCGEISGGKVGTAPLIAPGGKQATHAMPVTGAGVAAGHVGSAWLILTFALAAVSAMAGRLIGKSRKESSVRTPVALRGRRRPHSSDS